MTGLQERDVKLREKNKRKLKECPEYVADWYYYLKSSNISESTCYDYINKIITFLKFIDEDINSIKISDIKLQNVVNYMADKREIDGVNSSDSYKQCIWSALNNFFDYCCKTGVLKENYMKNIKRAKNKDLERIKKNRIKLTDDNYTDILESVKEGVGSKKAKSTQKKMINRNITIFLLLMTTGMRKSALCQINLEDVDISKRTIFVTDKNEKSFEYYLSDDTFEYLQYWLEDRKCYSRTSEALFITDRGNRISTSAMDKLVDKYGTPIVGRHMSSHKFRSGFCSNVFGITGNIEFTRRAVGHSNISTTQRYISTDNTEQEKAANIMNQLFK